MEKALQATLVEQRAIRVLRDFFSSYGVIKLINYLFRLTTDQKQDPIYFIIMTNVEVWSPDEPQFDRVIIEKFIRTMSSSESIRLDVGEMPKSFWNFLDLSLVEKALKDPSWQGITYRLSSKDKTDGIQTFLNQIDTTQTSSILLEVAKQLKLSGLAWHPTKSELLDEFQYMYVVPSTPLEFDKVSVVWSPILRLGGTKRPMLANVANVTPQAGAKEAKPDTTQSADAPTTVAQSKIDDSDRNWRVESAADVTVRFMPMGDPIARRTYQNDGNPGRTGEKYHLSKWRDARRANKIVIAKVLTTQNDDIALGEFVEEVLALKKLTEHGCAHYISPYLDHFKTTAAIAESTTQKQDGEKYVYYVLLMEFIEGPTILQWAQKPSEHNFPELKNARQRAHFVATGLRGLECIHALGFAHRDIYGRNLVLRTRMFDGTPYIEPVFIDMGLATSHDAMRASNASFDENSLLDGNKLPGKALVNRTKRDTLAKEQAVDIELLAALLAKVVRYDPEFHIATMRQSDATERRYQILPERGGNDATNRVNEAINMALTLCDKVVDNQYKTRAVGLSVAQIYRLFAMDLNSISRIE